MSYVNVFSVQLSKTDLCPMCLIKSYLTSYVKLTTLSFISYPSTLDYINFCHSMVPAGIHA